MLGLARDHRRPAANAESHQLVAGCDHLGRPLEIGDDQLPFGGVDRAMDVLEDDLPDRRLAEIVAGMRRLFQIDPPDHETLRKLHLEFTHADATDGAAEARHRRFADAGAARQFAIGRMQREIDIGQNRLGDAPLRWTKLGAVCLMTEMMSSGGFETERKSPRACRAGPQPSRFRTAAISSSPPSSKTDTASSPIYRGTTAPATAERELAWSKSRPQACKKLTQNSARYWQIISLTFSQIIA